MKRMIVTVFGLWLLTSPAHSETTSSAECALSHEYPVNTKAFRSVNMDDYTYLKGFGSLITWPKEGTKEIRGDRASASVTILSSKKVKYRFDNGRTRDTEVLNLRWNLITKISVTDLRLNSKRRLDFKLAGGSRDLLRGLQHVSLDITRSEPQNLLLSFFDSSSDINLKRIRALKSSGQTQVTLGAFKFFVTADREASSLSIQVTTQGLFTMALLDSETHPNLSIEYSDGSQNSYQRQIFDLYCQKIEAEKK